MTAPILSHLPLPPQGPRVVGAATGGPLRTKNRLPRRGLRLRREALRLRRLRRTVQVRAEPEVSEGDEKWGGGNGASRNE